MNTNWKAYNYTIIYFEDNKGPVRFRGEVKSLQCEKELNFKHNNTRGKLAFRGDAQLYTHSIDHLRPALLLEKEKFYEKTKEEPFYATDKDGDYWWTEYVLRDPSIIQWKHSKVEDYILISTYDHTFRDFNGEIVPCVRRFSYMDGFKEADADYCVNWDIVKLHNALKNCPHVLSCNLTTIPYYNARYSGQKQVEFSVYVPKETPGAHEFNSWKNLGSNYLSLIHDVLGIKDCLKPEPYRENDEGEYDPN